MLRKLYSANFACNSNHTEPFMDLWSQLDNIVKSTYTGPKMHVCVKRVATDAFWAAAVTKCVDYELEKKFATNSMNRKPYLCSRLSTAQEHWKMFEKKVYVLVQAFNRLSYNLRCVDLVTALTNHLILLSAFYPTAVEPPPRRHKYLKDLCLALWRLAFFNWFFYLKQDAKKTSRFHLSESFLTWAAFIKYLYTDPLILLSDNCYACPSIS